MKLFRRMRLAFPPPAIAKIAALFALSGPSAENWIWALLPAVLLLVPTDTIVSPVGFELNTLREEDTPAFVLEVIPPLIVTSPFRVGIAALDAFIGPTKVNPVVRSFVILKEHGPRDVVKLFNGELSAICA